MSDFLSAVHALAPVIAIAALIVGTASLAFNGCIGGWILVDQIRLRRRARATGRTVDELMDGDDWARRNGYCPARLDEPRPAIPPSLAAHIAEHLAADVDEEWRRISEATGGAA